MKEWKKLGILSFGVENKTSPQDNFLNYTNEMEPENYTPQEKNQCDWTDKSNYAVH